jgi:hypothetical protein
MKTVNISHRVACPQAKWGIFDGMKYARIFLEARDFPCTGTP